MPYTKSTLGTNIWIYEKDPTTGYATMVSGYGAPTTDASEYAPGCVYVDRLNYLTYVNRGTAAAPKWSSPVGKYFTTCTATNGTTNVDIFGTGGAPSALTITGVYLISKDTTAGNVTVLQGANTVCTIAKGTSAGALVGATSLSNTVYAAGDVAQVDCSSAGDSFVFITWILS